MGTDSDGWLRRRGSKLALTTPAKSIGLALALIATVVATPARAQFTPFEAAIAEFDAEVAAGVAEDAAGCVSLAVFIADDVIWSKGYGWADIENRIACTERSIGRTGSISKSFTAVLMIQLVERGLIGLDDPVVDYLPELRDLADPPPDMRPITFRMLASHTAGLIREPRWKVPPRARSTAERRRFWNRSRTPGSKLRPGRNTHTRTSDSAFSASRCPEPRACRSSPWWKI